MVPLLQSPPCSGLSRWPPSAVRTVSASKLTFGSMDGDVMSVNFPQDSGRPCCYGAVELA